MKKTYFITGTDTGVGKTLFTALLAGYLRESGERVAALKPICSGGRQDAVMLHRAIGGALALEEINPWHFHAPIAPLLAAQRENKRVGLAQVLGHIRVIRRRHNLTLVEGAGGLLSPMGVDFNSRDLIAALGATPIIVAPNRLGVVNHLLLTLEALPLLVRRKARVVLMAAQRPDLAARQNAVLLAQLAVGRVHLIPWLGASLSLEKKIRNSRLRAALAGIVNGGEGDFPFGPRRR